MQLLSKSFLLVFTLVPVLVFAQSPTVKTAAELARLKKLAAAVEANPENVKAHNAYIEALHPKDTTLQVQYKAWMKRFPKSPTVPFVAGKHYANKEDPKAKLFLLKAVELKPDLAEGWFLLFIDALRWGDEAASRQYIEKAMKAEPKNAEYAYHYASTYQNSDRDKFISLLYDLVWRYSDSDRAAVGLFQLGFNSISKNEALAYFEQLRRRYSDNIMYLNGLSPYFDLLLKTDVSKSFELALSMVLNKDTKNRNAWKEREKVARSFLEVRRLLEEKKPEDAAEILKKVNLGSPINSFRIYADETLILLKAEVADAANQTQAAYDSLALFYSKEPGQLTRSALLGYAAKLGKDENHVDSVIWKLREARAHPATEFLLSQYLKEEKVSLADFKGKVVLLTYWYPGCGPCRAEFPHFENVLKKFGEDKIAYLGINGLPEQDEYVESFMKSSGYSFIPLREDPLRDRGNLGAMGYPTNFVIDQNGRIIFSDFQINKDNENTLELMIKELLDSGKS